MKKVKEIAYTLLRRSEKYVKTDAVYVASGGFWLAIGTAVTSIITLGLAVAFSHLVPKEVYGNYKYILTLADILGALTLTGISTAVLRAAARKLDGSLKEGFLISLKWSLPMVALALIGSAYYFYNENTTLGTGLLLIAIFSPIISATGLYNSFLEGKSMFKTKVAFGVLRTGVPAAALLAAIFYSNSALVIVAAFFISHAAIATFLHLITAAKFVQNTETNKETLRLGKHFSVINIVNTVSSQIDKVLIFHFLGGTQLAIYAFATLVPQHVSGVFNNLSTLAFPKFAQKNLKELRASVFEKTWKLGFLILIVIGAYIIAAPYLYQILFPAYVEAAVYSQVGIFILIAVSALFASTALRSTGTVKELHIITTSVSIAKIIILVPAVMWFGLWGAITATVAVKILKTLLTLFYFNRAANKVSTDE